MLNIYFFVALVFLCYNHSVSAISCYECQSTFPSSSVCLPTCTTSFRPDSICVLVRNISLDPDLAGSLRAAHLSDIPSIPSVAERNFIFGEEAVYQNPNPVVGWDWEYGPITFGCDKNGCNEPGDINRLPNALNARIPNSTLEQLLLGDLTNNCYVCDTCLDPDVTNTNMSACTIEPCPNHACGFVATRDSPTSTAQCGTGWHFSSYCVGSREPAQIDMTLIYYIGSKTTYLYQMAAACLNNNCNNVTVFKQLKDAITIDPDLTCLIDYTNATTTTISSSTRPPSSTTTTGRSSSTTTRGASTTTTRGGSTTTTGGGSTTTTRGGSTTTTGGGSTTTPGGTVSTTTSSAEPIFINIRLLIFIISLFFLYN